MAIPKKVDVPEDDEGGGKYGRGDGMGGGTRSISQTGYLLSSQESGLRGCISFSVSSLVHVGLAVAAVVVEGVDQLAA